MEDDGQKAIIGRVMDDFKARRLKGSEDQVVRNRKQAIAIGLSEAGASNRVSPAENRHNRARTEQRMVTRADLEAEAAQRGIAGRSRMSKD